MIRTAVSALLVAFGITGLSGCGSGRPAATTSRPGESPSATISAPPDSVGINGSVQLFATPLPASLPAARVMASFREAIVAWDESVGNLFLAPPVTDYVVGDVRKDLDAALAAEKKDNYVPSGTDRLWDTKVTAITAHSATITTCEDETKAVLENPDTGELLPAPPLDQQYMFETWNLVPMHGHWAITSVAVAYIPDPSAAACDPATT